MFKGPNVVGHEFVWEEGDGDFGEPEPTPFSSAPVLVTERPKGPSLYQWIHASGNSRSLKACEVISIGRQGLEFLRGLKQKGISHGGLNPTKINYDETTDEVTFSSSFSQKQSYRSPEIILDIDNTSSVDMWALGCILFELYTGEPLFKSQEIPDSIAFDCCHLWQMSKRLGSFRPEFIAESPRFSELYERASQSRIPGVPFYRASRGFPTLPTARLGDAIRSARERRGDPGSVAKSMIEMIEPMLRYEERISPEAALQNPLFQSELASLS